mmetsp:Transcript_10125/g.15460  ORF Transcript_10125/g.15460 Transcript_10125/m.15460 type:complete len:103 (-) Transcript_10125:627-935(-)
MNLKTSTHYFTASQQPLTSHYYLPSYQPFCNLTDFKLVGVQTTGVGILPKSLLQLGNGDIIVSSFSRKDKKNVTFKAFLSHPFQRLNKKLPKMTMTQNLNRL